MQVSEASEVPSITDSAAEIPEGELDLSFSLGLTSDNAIPVSGSQALLAEDTDLRRHQLEPNSRHFLLLPLFGPSTPAANPLAPAPCTKHPIYSPYRSRFPRRLGGYLESPSFPPFAFDRIGPTSRHGSVSA